MSTAPKRVTPAEYLAIEARDEVRHEYFDGEVFAMGGGTLWHNLIKDNLAHAIRKRLEGRECYVITSDQRVKVDATGLYTYPDVVVFCEPPVFEDAVHHTLVNPRLIVEVLSDSTEKYDRGKKFGHYRRLESVAEYLVVAQDRISAELFSRQPAPGAAAGTDPWLLRTFSDSAGTILFDSLGVEVTLAEIYAGVPLPGAGDAGQERRY